MERLVQQWTTPCLVRSRLPQYVVLLLIRASNLRRWSGRPWYGGAKVLLLFRNRAR